LPFQPDLTGSFLFAPLGLDCLGRRYLLPVSSVCICVQTTECSDFPPSNGSQQTNSGSSGGGGSPAAPPVATPAPAPAPTPTPGVVDTTPPVMSSGSPAGTLAVGTTQANVTLSTNEAAICRHSILNETYPIMDAAFTTTGGTSHSFTKTNLAGGNVYTYYVRCMDSAGNMDTSSLIISFSVGTVASAPAPTPSPAPNPTPSPSGSAWFTEDYSTYSNQTEYLGNKNGWYVTNEDTDFQQPSNAGSIVRNGVIDPSVSYNGHQTLRYDYYDRTGNPAGLPNRCTDYTVGRNLKLPSTTKELWLEAYVKFQPGFTTVAPSSWGCGSNPDLKFILARLNGVNDRFILKVGTSGGSWKWGQPPGGEDNFSANLGSYPAFDGAWHRVRLHFKIADSSTSNNGSVEYWYDNTYLGGTKTASTLVGGVLPSNIYGIAMGRNMNQGPGALESLWWGSVQIWNTNPGW
jgi:hypothetical protein